MKLINYLKEIGKKNMYYFYYLITDDVKDYDRITGKKIVEEIIKFYSDYNNILEMCTEKELRFLEKVLNNEKDLFNNKYFLEHFQLFKKMIIYDNDEKEEVTFFEDIYDFVKEALKRVDWKKIKKNDEINSLLIGYLKVSGNASIESITSIGAMFLDMSEDDVYEWLNNNKLIKYCTVQTEEFIESIGDYIILVNYYEYLNIIDIINEERAKQAGAGFSILKPEEYREVFYTGFCTRKASVKKLVKEINNLGNIGEIITSKVRICALLNGDRQEIFDLIDYFTCVGLIKSKTIKDLIDPALDDMPSAVLNGLTPNENDEKKQKNLSMNYQYKKNGVKQENANVSKSDKDLFYKLYFGLLEYTNRKYRVVPKLKIYEAKGLDPAILYKVIDKLWKNIDENIDEFIQVNPFKFNKEELDIINDFKRGKSDTFIITKYEKDYTMFLSLTGAYMVKGLTSNMDEIIPLNCLPVTVITRLLPFKGYIIYDSILNQIPISIGSNMKNNILNDMSKAKKIYKL